MGGQSTKPEVTTQTSRNTRSSGRETVSIAELVNASRTVHDLSRTSRVPSGSQTKSATPVSPLRHAPAEPNCSSSHSALGSKIALKSERAQTNANTRSAHKTETLFSYGNQTKSAAYSGSHAEHYLFERISANLSSFALDAEIDTRLYGASRYPTGHISFSDVEDVIVSDDDCASFSSDVDEDVLSDTKSTYRRAGDGQESAAAADGYGDDDDVFEESPNVEERMGGDDEEEVEFDLRYFSDKRSGDASKSRRDRKTHSHIYDSMVDGTFSELFVGGEIIKLPSDCRHRKEPTYEEVVIPPPNYTTTAAEQELMPIAELDEVSRKAFRGMQTLNLIQTIVFDAAYNTDENLLICAPTGAGKTNIAMLAVLHEVRKHIQQGVVKIDEFKIVYVAPMKALAAEMVETFGSRLKPLGISVKELTGDSKLTKKEIMQSQMLVVTPEKWDVITRKSTGDATLIQLVKLLIIDEVHLLHEDRGAVIECLVARTLRQVEAYESNVRIVGLSATLPNYKDVAKFLHVNIDKGLFFFDARFRPVPLQQSFIGVKNLHFKKIKEKDLMNDVCFEKMKEVLENGHQVLVFVFSRNGTRETADELLRRLARESTPLFCTEKHELFKDAEKELERLHDKILADLVPQGFAVHHAGISRPGRNFVEKYFAAGLIRVLCCTTTLAWGVNLPAHAVIIKGTKFYNPDTSRFEDVGILDVLQIFGRAGRPQFDTFGEGYIITSHSKLLHYLKLLMTQNPIESQFKEKLADNLNAEIVLGTVSNTEEALRWLRYTYLYIRMRLNPKAYGLGQADVMDDRNFENVLKKLVTTSARLLQRAKMVKTDVRKEEKDELETLDERYCEVYVSYAKPIESGTAKVNILLQAYISHVKPKAFSLVSDMNNVAQNAARLMRALFEMALDAERPHMADQVLKYAKAVDQRIWPKENPLSQFHSWECHHVIASAPHITAEDLKKMDPLAIGDIVYNNNKKISKDEKRRCGLRVQDIARQLPFVSLDVSLQPLDHYTLRICVKVTLDFIWKDWNHVCGSEHWWIWVEDSSMDVLHHYEYFSITKRQVEAKEPQDLFFIVRLPYDRDVVYTVRAISEDWLGVEAEVSVRLDDFLLPSTNEFYSVTTAANWEAVSRTWETVRDVSLIILDGLQFLGDECGPMMETIVARAKRMSHHTGRVVRMVGLSTTMANAKDVARWLEVDDDHLFNFQSVHRPVKLELNVAEFSGKFYHIRTAAMNKPVFNAIKTTKKRVLVFVSSRKQATATAFELVAFLRHEENPQMWCRLKKEKVDDMAASVFNQNLQLALSYGVGVHHPGLSWSDRRTVEKLYRDKHLKVLVATKRLAWSTDLRARLVIVKGTEQYDVRTRRYVDMPVTDILQMIGRAGRYGKDSRGTALVMVQNTKREFYETALRDPVSLESRPNKALPEYVNAEVASGNIKVEQDFEDYMKTTFFYTRLTANPSYYGLPGTSEREMTKFMAEVIESTLVDLSDSQCIRRHKDEDRSVSALPLGRIASQNHIHHDTVKMIKDRLKPDSSI
ncbi:activating signal cointegrator 1 complex subunit 3-like [Diadema setosum]|uniref:activating signal cointegrator 1 complex subunit 3-like n=1 Tax=Diadema setosum TaxID=31175 RepID=UPI003B3ABE7D